MINIVICDDEKSYQEILEFKIKKIFSDELNLECQIDYVSSLEDLENFIENKRVEIVFLDIMVNENNSIDWLIKRKENRSFKEQYIVMTAFPIESYRISEVETCFYLIKSKMTDEQLLKGIKKAINCVTKKEANQKIIKIGKTNYKINLQEITFIETFNNSIMIHMATGEKYHVYSTLKEFEKELTPNFLRCHKSYMVNMNFIAGYEPHKFLLKNSEQVSIPPKKYAEMIDKYRNYLINL